MKPLTIILANAPLQNGNRGCVALTLSTLFLIDVVMSKKNMQYKIMLSDARIKSSSFSGVCNINGKDIPIESITYNAAYSKKTEKLLFLKNVLLSFIKRKKKNMFKNADYILNIGQGDSFSDIYGIPRFGHIDLSYKIARFYKKPYCVLPQTIGPYENAVVMKEAIESIENATLVMTRDKQSFRYAKQISPNAKVKEYIDVAFFLPYSVIKQPKEYIHVGLNISALLWNGGYTKNNQFGLASDYKKTMRAINEYFLSCPNVKIHLVSHVVEPDLGIENDYQIAYELWKEYNSERVVLAPFALSPIDVKSYIAGLDFFVGSRMHATIAAFSAGVPVVPMAYSRKFNGLFKDTLQYDYMIDLKSDTKEETIECVRKFFNDRHHIKDIVVERLSGVVENRKQMILSDLESFFFTK